MGKTSSQTKQKWNEKHYIPVKALVKPGIAAAFKAACADAGTSMASELSNFMDMYANPPQKNMNAAINVKTLGSRRKAMALIHALMIEMRDAEEELMDNMPENLRSSSRYEDADERMSKLDEALDFIDDIY